LAVTRQARTARARRLTLVARGRPSLSPLSFPCAQAGDALTFKDLGPQIGYSTVFFLEYFGPMVIYPLFYFGTPLIYGAPHAPVLAQRLACAYHTFHYAKRIAETFLVHEFSHGTMPIANLFRNCGYYWSFAAAISYFVNHPAYTSPPEARVKAAFGAAMVCQLLNAYAHIVLSRLRADGSKGYKIPYSLLAGFNFVTCANYMWEILGWACFNVATQSVMGVVFNVCGAGQMALWAIAKHARLRKVFDGKDGRQRYPRRWKMLPPFF
jgi:very-long-chain enoyl-CoA reductase